MVLGCLGDKNDIWKVARYFASRQLLMTRFDRDEMHGQIGIKHGLQHTIEYKQTSVFFKNIDDKLIIHPSFGIWVSTQ